MIRARILKASAGAGKTYNLAYKFIHDVIKHYHEKPYLYRAILAVTFTNKATEEMKGRILGKIHELATNPSKSDYIGDLIRDTSLSQEQIKQRATAVRTAILHDYSRFTILTIDKFFQRIFKAFIKELGRECNYEIELDTETIIAHSIDSLIEEITSNEELQKWMYDFATQDAEAGAAWDIRQKIKDLGKEIFKESNLDIITKSLKRVELEAIVLPALKRYNQTLDEFIASGKEALKIMQENGFGTTDFSGKSRSFANYFKKVADTKKFATVEPPTVTAIEKSQTTDKWSTNANAQALAPRLKPLLEQIITLYNENINFWNSMTAINGNYRSYALLNDIYDRAMNLCREENIMLLSETKHLLAELIGNNDTPFIYEKIGNRFERFMIDEFQDTSQKEWNNFVPLLRNAMSESEDESVFIVGDIKQSIYRWRGGDWRILNQGVAESLGKDNIEIKPLKQNWRSLPCVIEFNNEIIQSIVNAENADLNQMLSDAFENGAIGKECKMELSGIVAEAYSDLKQEVAKTHPNQGFIHIENFPSQEQPPLENCIESLINRGYSYSDIMILNRNAKQTNKTAKILMDYKNTLESPFNIMTQDSLVISASDVSLFIISVLRLSQNNSDSIARAHFNSYLGKEYGAPLEKDEIRFLAEIGQLTPENAFERIVVEFSLNEKTDEIAYIQAIHEQIISFSASKTADIQHFLKMWDEKGSEQSLSVEKSDNTIELLTIHKAKGLEKKVVILPFCNWELTRLSGTIFWAKPSTLAQDHNEEETSLTNIGRFPIDYTKNIGKSIFCEDYYRELVYSHIDGINMLYVALTRAKEELYIYLPRWGSQGSDQIAKRLWDATLANPTLNGKYAAKKGINPDTEQEYVEYGEKVENPQKEKSEDKAKTVIQHLYPTSLNQVPLNLPQQRYFEQTESSEARNIGIMMHSIMNEATDKEDILRRIGKAFAKGDINAEQEASLRLIIEREFERPQVNEWFGKWESVKNENDIICKKKTDEKEDEKIGTRRPDRVMISGDRAIVVDYKFGQNKTKKHKEQIQRYKKLLLQMGYRSVECYLWYLTLGEIVNCDE